MRLFPIILALSCTALVPAQRTITTLVRGNSYDLGIGNTWLGGSVHAHGLLTTRVGAGLESGEANVGVRARASLLKLSTTVFEVSGSVANKIEGQTQTSTGRAGLRVLGVDVPGYCVTFSRTTTFPRKTWAMTAFSTPRFDGLTVGPFSISIEASAGMNGSLVAEYRLPASTPGVSITGAVQGGAYAHGTVGIGIPYLVEFGADLSGNILEQNLSFVASANARTGFSGAITYTLNAIRLRLSVYLDTILHRWTTPLTSWTLPAAIRSFL